jgi:hypothetical protein
MVGKAAAIQVMAGGFWRFAKLTRSTVSISNPHCGGLPAPSSGCLTVGFAFPAANPGFLASHQDFLAAAAASVSHRDGFPVSFGAFLQSTSRFLACSSGFLTAFPGFLFWAACREQSPRNSSQPAGNSLRPSGRSKNHFGKSEGHFWKEKPLKTKTETLKFIPFWPTEWFDRSKTAENKQHHTS